MKPVHIYYTNNQSNSKSEPVKSKNEKLIFTKDESQADTQVKHVMFRKFRPRSSETFNHICSKSRCNECYKVQKSKYLLFTNLQLTSVHLPKNDKTKIEALEGAKTDPKASSEDSIFDLKVPYEQVHSLHIYSLCIFRYFVRFYIFTNIFSLSPSLACSLYQDFASM